jgi:general secretion pathway protein H
VNLRHRAHGFSLIEILVVVVIVAIVSSIALLSLGLIGDDRDLQTEARRFAALAEVAQDEAMLQGREFGLEVMATAYRFVEYDPFTNQWGELYGDDILRQRQLPEDAEFDLFLEGQRVQLDPDPANLEDSDRMVDNDLVETFEPHIFLFSSGDVSPFELHILRSAKDQNVVIRHRIAEGIEIVNDEN